MKTAELTGALLDYWVARAEGIETVLWVNEGPLEQAACVLKERRPNAYPTHYQPSTNWAHGGPLIEKYTITPYLSPLGGWAGYHRPELHMHETHAPTPLVAICRAVVHLAYGDDVEEVES